MQRANSYMPCDPQSNDTPSIPSILAQTRHLHEQVTHHVLRDKPYIRAIDYLLRGIIALLDGRHSADEYVHHRLRSGVGLLGYHLGVRPEDQCNQKEPCHFHRHKYDLLRRPLRRRIRGTV